MKVTHPKGDTLHGLNLVVYSFYVAVIPRVIKAGSNLLKPVIVGA